MKKLGEMQEMINKTSDDLIEKGISFKTITEQCETVGDLQKLDQEYREALEC